VNVVGDAAAVVINDACKIPYDDSCFMIAAADVIDDAFMMP
jgi:hypothetical protein